MATTIAQAVLARFATSTISDFTASQGLWLEAVPPGTALPLPIIGFVHQGQRNEYASELEYFEVGSFEFTIFAVTVAETERLGLLVKALFDLCNKNPGLIQIANATVEEFTRTTGQIGVDPEAQADNKQVGRETFVYEYRVQRTLPTS